MDQVQQGELNPDFRVKQPGTLNPDFYQRHSPIRGRCLVINNNCFPQYLKHELPERRLAYRDGTVSDARAIECVWKQLHFDNEVRRDAVAGPDEEDSLYEILEDEIEMLNKSTYDAFVCYILTHGNRDGELMMTDGNSVLLSEILQLFNRDNCHGLVNKPKLFFIQACRGANIDAGADGSRCVKPACEQNLTESGGERLLDLPAQSDVLVCYSTVQGFASYHMHGELGSHFIQSDGSDL